VPGGGGPRRAWILAVVAVLALAACDPDGARPTPSRDAPTTSPTASPTESPPSPSVVSPSPSPSATPGPKLGLPPDAPTTYKGSVAPHGPFEPLVPQGAEVLDAWVQQLAGQGRALAAVVWGRGDDPFARELGFVLWERSGDGTWRATHAFTDPPSDGLLGISLDRGDLTRDGVDDAVTFESIGGSGDCGTYRVIAPSVGGAEQVLKRQTCDAELAVVGGHLELTEAVYGPDDAHCCPSAFRVTTLEWDGARFTATNVERSPVPPS
jgi:hypothetical protein